MAPVKAHRIQIGNRTQLQDVIPLQTPFVVYIDPSSACNFRCRFCPTGERGAISRTSRWMGPMSMDVFKKAVDDLCEFGDAIKVLKLYKDGEPLLNKNFPEMVEYAKRSVSVRCVETTTNGSMLTPRLVDLILAAGLDRINISVYGMSDEEFYSFSRAKVNFKTYVDNIKYLHRNRRDCHIHIKTTRNISSNNNINVFFETFGPYCDSIDVENLSPFWPGYYFPGKENVISSGGRGTFGQKLEPKLVCPYLFYALAINADGKVDLCSCDWTHNYCIGDVRKQRLKAIWESDKLHAEQTNHLKGLRMQHPLCRECYEIMYESVDNIDNFRSELLNRLIKVQVNL